METIKSREEISDLFSCGKRLNTPFLTLIVLPVKQHDHSGRVAFIAGKKNGNAVWRNSAKRRMREVARSLGAPWEGYDVAFLARRKILSAPYQDVLSSVEKTLKKNGLR